MAPLIHLLALFALATTILASPHISRSVYNHAHRDIAHIPIDVDSRSSHPLPKRKRSLNKRCVPRPTTNSTTSAFPTSTVPINVAPIPSLASTTSSTSSYVPPPPTSSAPSPTDAPYTSTTPPPTTSSTPPPATTTSSTAAPAQTSTSSSNSGLPSYMTGTQNGQATFYEVGLGACGQTNNDSQNIVAVSEDLFDSYPGYDGVNPNANPVCGKNIEITYGGVSVTVVVQDRCTGCSLTDLDLSPLAFDVLAAASVGRIDMTWKWS